MSWHCEQCDGYFKDSKTLDDHVNEIHTFFERSENYPSCEVCKEKLPPSSLKSHYEQKHAKCLECGKMCKTASELKKHLEQKLNEKKWKCQSCEDSFSELLQLRNHVLTEHISDDDEEREKKNVVKMAQCEKCGLVMPTTIIKVHVMRHVSKDTKVRPFSCDVCGLSFLARGNLRSHSLVHTEEKPHHCQVCGKGFKTNAQLRSHGVVHTTERPFQCKICQKAFNRKTCLQRHLDIHINEQRYVCEFCERRFTEADAMKVHLRTHTKEKPFSCSKCGKAVSHKVSLKNHVCVSNDSD